MRKLLLTLLTGFLLLPHVASAAVTFDLNDIRAVIDANDVVQVGKNIILDGSQSFVPDEEAPVAYEWDFGDKSPKEFGAEVVHSYPKAGEYLVTLTVSQKGENASITRSVFAYQKLTLFLTDVTDRRESVEKLTDKAFKEGTYVNVIESYDSNTAFMSEETLSKKLVEQVNMISGADTIAIWTTRGSGINALTRLVRERPDIQEFLKDKTIVVISDKNLKTLSRIMQSNYNIIKPKQIVLTREYELNNLISAPNVQTFVTDLKEGVSEYRIIDAETRHIGLWNFMSYLVNFMLTQGVPSNTIVLLLMLPVIATIIAFLKQVIGVTTFGLYTPSIITLSFLALGLKFGLAILIIILLTGSILRKALAHVRLLHIPRMAIVFTISTLIILLMLGFGTYLNIQELASIAVFPMLIMTTLAEKFVSAQSGKGVYAAVLLMLETTVVSLICYWVVEWQFLQNLILSYPEIILFLILVNLGLGRWTGLRFFEYIRFREVMRHTEE
ncbi:PKD domain-containing protein [Candidatus Peregrinibacteria bacterium]|nr:PKD domain-containing protein [Candidatus Peregrinibacteria bacterium]